MTFDQALAFAIVIGMMGLFAWASSGYDLVALLALLQPCRGIVPRRQAFDGFSDDIVIIVARRWSSAPPWRARV